MGKPRPCLADRVKLAQYWKQLVERLKKHQNVCRGEMVLRAKTCKKVTTEARMTLMHRSEEEVRKSKTRPQSGDEVTAAEEKVEVMMVSPSEGRAKPDLQPAQSFCSQGWSSVCYLFLTLLQAPGGV